MQYTSLGTTGLKVSRICLGCMTYGSKSWRPWVLEEAESLPFIRRAWEAGVNFFDTADMYSLGASETILGNALRHFSIPRDRVVVATKVFNAMSEDPNHRGLSRKHIHHAVDDSLRRLRTDYIDLYQIHRFDPATPIEETVVALDQLVKAGKVLYLGASSMYAWQFATMLHTQEKLGLARFVTMQNHYNLVYREEEREMNPLCQAKGVGLIPWSPLARGFLAGNRSANKAADPTTRAQTDDFAHKLYYQSSDFEIVERLSGLAKERNLPNAQIALAWLLTKPGVTAPIVGASKPHHLDDALASLNVTLTPKEIAHLEAPYQPHPILGHS